MIKLGVITLVMWIGALWFSGTGERNIVADVKSGERVLECNDRVINPERVEAFVDGVWYFDNGSMRNCVTR